jgi:hypothetical protein
MGENTAEGAKFICVMVAHFVLRVTLTSKRDKEKLRFTRASSTVHSWKLQKDKKCI